MSSLDELVGANVRALREEVGMTQRDLAASLRQAGWQIDTTALTRIEAGARSLRVSQLRLLADALGREVGDVVPGVGAGYEAGFAAGVRAAAEAVAGVSR